MPTHETVDQIRTLLETMPKERASLLPALWAVADEMGWIDEERTKAIAEVLNLPVADVFGVASFYALLPTEPARPVRVCDDVMCRLKGSDALIAELRREGIEALASPCLGRCDQAPAALIGKDPLVHADASNIRATVRGEG